VHVRGPFGNAFFRKAEGRLVLIATGTGWAPIWAVARAARLEQPEREMIVVVGARDSANLYMHTSVGWLRKMGVQQITMTCSGGGAAGPVQSGRPTVHLPGFLASDTIFVAGAPAMVAAVEALAERSGAVCHADPFLPASQRRRLRQVVTGLIHPRTVAAGIMAALHRNKAYARPHAMVAGDNRVSTTA
jgi:3-phenylpropionate/trans-cinnamate dioxygenase ferredoxin reductase subunit